MGKHAAFAPPAPQKPMEPLGFELVKGFPDGLSNTILFADAADGVPWTKPDELDVDDASKPLPKLGGLFDDGFHVAFGDGSVKFVLTARAENYLHGRRDLADTIARLQAYQEAGADVLFAPRVVDPVELRQLLASVDVPVSVLITPDAPAIGALAELGVSRISVGGAIAAASYGFAIEAVKELQTNGLANYWEQAGAARADMAASFVKP